MGLQESYKNGQFFRRRYNNLLGDHGYKYEKMYLLSTDAERAIMSAQACLAGMFPITNENKWNDEIPWYPIPVHTLPFHVDNYFRGGKLCPKYWSRLDYYMTKSPQALHIWEKYGDYIKYMSNVSNTDLSTIDKIADFHRNIVAFGQNKK